MTYGIGYSAPDFSVPTGPPWPNTAYSRWAVKKMLLEAWDATLTPEEAFWIGATGTPREMPQNLVDYLAYLDSFDGSRA